MTLATGELQPARQDIGAARSRGGERTRDENTHDQSPGQDRDEEIRVSPELAVHGALRAMDSFEVSQVVEVALEVHPVLELEE